MEKNLLNDEQMQAVSGGAGNSSGVEVFYLTVKEGDTLAAIQNKLNLDHGGIPADQRNTILESLKDALELEAYGRYKISVSAISVAVKQQF